MGKISLVQERGICRLYDPKIHRIYMLFHPGGAHTWDDYIGPPLQDGDQITTEQGMRGRICGEPHYSALLGWTATIEVPHRITLLRTQPP